MGLLWQPATMWAGIALRGEKAPPGGDCYDGSTASYVTDYGKWEMPDMGPIPTAYSPPIGTAPQERIQLKMFSMPRGVLTPRGVLHCSV